MNHVLFAKMDQVFSKENKTLKNAGKLEKKYRKSKGILSVRKSGNPDYVHYCLQWYLCLQKEVYQQIGESVKLGRLAQSEFFTLQLKVCTLLNLFVSRSWIKNLMLFVIL